jgi:hypothetical protein
MIPSKALIVCLVTGLLAPTVILAQDTTGGEEILARIHFDPKTYELYRPWADKWFEELEKPQAPHREPQLDGWSFTMPVEWVRAILSTAAVQSDDGSAYVVTVTRPLTWQRTDCSSFLEDLVFKIFFENNGFAKELWNDKKEEVDRQIKEIVKAKHDLAYKQGELTQNLERDRRTISDETLQQQIAAIEEGPKLELEMNLAELEARREAIMKKLEEARKDEDMAMAWHRKHAEVEWELKRKRTTLELGESMKASGNDVSAEELEQIEARVDELGRTLEELERKMPRAEPGNLQESLKEMLAQAEIDYAGFEARRKVLFDQYVSLKERLQQRVDIQNHIDELDSRYDELSDKSDALSNELNSDEYRTPRPVIEWVPEPEAAAS